MNKRISRRQLLKTLAAATGVAGLCKVLGVPFQQGIAQEMEESVYLPMINRSGADTPTPTSTATSTSTPTSAPTAAPTATPTSTPASPSTDSRVVHVHSHDATFWDFGEDYYGDYVDQDVVNAMVDRGVGELTGADSVAQAWQTLVPGYAPGKAVAIKVNFNNNWVCQPTHVNLNNVIHPINAIVRGLKLAYPGFDEEDVWVYEACESWETRQLSQRFVAGCLYAGVRFFDSGCHIRAGYENADPTTLVTWNNPPGIAEPPETRLTDVLANATYLINMPLMKRHWAAGITLSLKNHMGSISDAWALHDWVYPTGDEYGGIEYSPIVDISLNPHIASKTVLILADALFGNWKGNNSEAEPWKTFGDAAPNSLLFATEPVAIDCVMCDLLDAEQQVEDFSDDYLVYASSVGLGTYERGEPWGDGYDQIEYKPVAM